MQFKNKLRVIPLGGTQEVGNNCMVLEYGNDMIMIDCGFGFPSVEMYGVDYVIPNMEYVKSKKENLRGIIVTHGHMDHTGALPYVLESIGNPPVYSGKLTIELIADRLKEFKLDRKSRLHPITSDTRFNLGVFNISFFKVNHNIPDSMGVVIRTPAGTVVHTGDFKFDNSPINEPVAEYSKIAKIGEEGVMLLCSDSTNANRVGHSISESSVTKILDDIISDAKGRVITATFASLITRIYQIVTISKKYGRKVAISGKSMETAIRVATKLGYIRESGEVFIPIKEIHKYPDDKITIITTGSQGEERSGLIRMATGEHSDVEIKSGDTVILSSSVVPENAVTVQNLIDELAKRGADVIHKDIMDVHAGGHAYQEDEKLLLHLIKPKFLMPIQGYQSFLMMHANTAKSIGFNKENIVIPRNGEVYEFSKDRVSKDGNVNASLVLVAGLGIGDVGTVLLKEREQLANYGVVVIALSYDENKKHFVGDPKIITKGFVFARASGGLIHETEIKVKQIIEENANSDLKELRNILSQRVEKFLYRKIERSPIVIPVIQNIS